MSYKLEDKILSPKKINYEIYPGNPLPFGASIQGEVVNFSIYSSYATSCTLVLFRAGEVTPFDEIEIPSSYRIGDVFAIGP